jgi:TPP-dependent pyruvate/acetoin dehydrogenase alpha subunit|tara:strand:+ start:2000 stop:2905 length:906 start_codon:yes stop_codon:yes gene_type:complete
VNADRLEGLYEQMLLIRRFEERVFELFEEGRIYGTTHGYIGQEANAVAVMSWLEERDVVVSNHRCHGHYLARTGNIQGLMAELMGKADGICGGRGGSQHLHDRNFYSNGVLGSTVPVAAGMALAELRKGTGAIGAVFIGDGTFGQGVLYETFNVISLWSVPLLVVVENNQYAQSTPLAVHFAGSFKQRAAAFGLSVGEVESTDVELISERCREAVQYVRGTQRPHVEVIHTFRLCAHSKGDDFRPPEEIEQRRQLDPLEIAGNRLAHTVRSSTDTRVAQRILDAVQAAAEAPFPSLTDDPS